MSHLKLLAPALFFIMTGCQTMSEEECQTADWRSIGFEDGAAGLPAQQIGQHREACASYGISPNLTAYNSGREEGLLNYCRPANGFNEGRSGVDYRGVCPGNLSPAFIQAHRAGREIGDLERSIHDMQVSLKNQKSSFKQALENASEVEIDSSLVNPDYTDGQRRERLIKAKKLEREKTLIQSEIRRLELEIRESQTRLKMLLTNAEF